MNHEVPTITNNNNKTQAAIPQPAATPQLIQLREPLLGIAVGKKGVGKTYTTFKALLEYVKGNMQKGIKPRKVLIIDVNNEYQGVKRIDAKHIQLFAVHPIIEMRRIVPYKPDGNKMTLNEIAELLWKCLKEFSGGLLLIEDINKYVSHTFPQDLLGAICTNRHSDLDIIMHYQSIGKITPTLWQNANWIRFHKNNDSVRRHESKLTDKFQIYRIVEEIVNTRYSQAVTKQEKSYHVFIDNDEMKIMSRNFSEKELDAAIFNYISEDYTAIMKPALHRAAMLQKPGGKVNKEEILRERIAYFKETYL